MALDKRRGVNISIASLGAFIPVALAAWFLIKPAVVGAVNDELQEHVQQTVSAQVQPLGTALGALIQGHIDDLLLRISVMEYQRDFPPIGDWSSEDARVLQGLYRQLAAQRAALHALRPTPRTS